MLQRHGAILCYHGITGGNLVSRPAFHVPVEQFASDVALLQSLGTIVPLADLLARVEAGRPTRGLFAITFDDAYTGVLDLALPVLRHAGAPASVFAVSGALTGGGKFWWDRIEDLEPHLSAPQWLAFAATFGLGAAGTAPTLTDIRNAILAHGAGRLSAGQESALERAEHTAGFSTAMRSLTAGALQRLASDPLVSVGPHTVTHAALATLGSDEVVDEVAGSMGVLRDLGVAPVAALAVPYGAGDDRTVALARQAGMRWCLGVAPRTLAGAVAARPVQRFVMSVNRRGWRFRAQVLGITDLAKGMLGRPEPDWPGLQRPSDT